jgi:hypothetical protein
MPTKDQFQIISFETGSHAFFSRRVILVEGDSELIALPHIAKMINSQWDLKANSISLVKINGKGSFKRYRDFFSKFNVNIMLLSDLDVLLDGFDKTDASDEMKAMRSDLLVAVDKIILDENLLANPSPKLLKEELQRERVKALHLALVNAREMTNVAEQCRILDEIFVFQKTQPRLEVLSDSSRADIVLKKRALLAALRTTGIFVLEKGAIEEYYPDTVTGGDKPSMAQSFCKLVKNREEVIALCQMLDLAGVQKPELEVIMEQIFSA